MSGSVSAISGTSYVQRAINITFQLGSGSFGDGSSNTVAVSNLRCLVNIRQAGSPAGAVANAKIYGLSQNFMNPLSSLDTLAYTARNNLLTIQAGDAVNGMPVVYKGYIYSSVQNYEDMPETCLDVVCVRPYFSQLAPATPISFQGSADVATMFSGIARQMGLGFQNNGVSVQLSNQYIAGTTKQQADKLAMAANVNVDYNDATTLSIWPKGGQKSGATPIISPATGLIGYPKQSGSQGVAFRTLFNPTITPGITRGSAVQLQSSYTQANGTWYVSALTHDLMSQSPGGGWFTDFECWKNPGGG